jgi:uncharacterized membrane protein YjfL (UPF0719 family)
MWHSAGVAALFGSLGIVLSVLGYKLFDMVETKIDFATEIKNGNVAAAIVIGAFMVGICIVISRAIGG